MALNEAVKRAARTATCSCGELTDSSGHIPRNNVDQQTIQMNKLGCSMHLIYRERLIQP